MKWSPPVLFIVVLFLAVILYLGLLLGTSHILQEFQATDIITNVDDNITYLETNTQLDNTQPHLLRASYLLIEAKERKLKQDFSSMKEAIAESSLLQSEYFLSLANRSDISFLKEQGIIPKYVKTYKIASLYQQASVSPTISQLAFTMSKHAKLSSKYLDYERVAFELLDLLAVEVHKLRASFERENNDWRQSVSYSDPCRGHGL